MSFLGSMISAPISAMNTANTNATNLAIAKMTNKANISLAKQQNEWNVEQWNRQNAYNDPSAQVQRLRGAGLSGAAAAQAIEGAGNAAPLQSANLSQAQVGAPMQPADLSSLANGFNILQAAREFQALKGDMIENKKKENELDFQVPFLMTDLDAKLWANKLSLQEFQYKAETNPYSANYLKWHALNEEQQFANLRLARRIQRTQHKILKQQYSFAEQWNAEQLKEIAERISNLKLEGENIKKTGRKIDTEVKVNNATAENIKANTEKTNVETENLKTSGKILKHEEAIAECRKILTEYGSPQGVAEQMAVFMVSKKMSYEQAYDFLNGIRQVLQYGKSSFVDSVPDSEYLKEYFYNVFNPGTANQYNYGFHSGGFWAPVKRRLGIDSLFE